MLKQKYVCQKRLKNKCKCDRSEDDEEDVDRTSNLKKPTNEANGKKQEGFAEYLTVDGNEEDQLTRTSCHDSGIDIRDALPTKKV